MLYSLISSFSAIWVALTDALSSEQLATSGKNLRRDAILVARNSHTLPFILGSFQWFIADRYTVGRPRSELSLLLYPREVLRILIQFVVTLPITVFIVSALVISLTLYEIALWTGLRLFGIPLHFLIIFLRKFLKNRRFLMSSTAHESAPVAHEATTTTRVNGTTIKDEYLATQVKRSAPILERTIVADMGPEHPKEVWFYINGIIEQGSMVTGTALLLEKMTGRVCNLLVNPSAGAGIDLLECILGRTLDTVSDAVPACVEAVVHQLSLGRKVVLIAHSQGGIILSNVTKQLIILAERVSDDQGVRDGRYAMAFKDGLSRVEAFSFCSAADEFPSGRSGPFAEHFAAESDFVSRIGVLHFGGLEGWNGKVHCLPETSIGNGHLMKEHILPSMLEGLFGRKSTFWRNYCDRNPYNALYNAPVEHIVEW